MKKTDETYTDTKEESPEGLLKVHFPAAIILQGTDESGSPYKMNRIPDQWFPIYVFIKSLTDDMWSLMSSHSNIHNITQKPMVICQLQVAKWVHIEFCNKHVRYVEYLCYALTQFVFNNGLYC